MKVEQTKSTRNQSTAQFTEICIFMGNNRFENGTISVGHTTTIQDGMLVIRDIAKVDSFKLATDADLADVVGITKVGFFPIELATGSDLNIAVAVKGEVDAQGLILPASTTLNTVVGKKVLRDVIEGIGIHLINTTEQTKF